MNDPLESDLKAALSECLATLPPSAGSRIRAIDYYGRCRRRRVLKRASGATAIAAAAATVALVGLGTDSGTQPAYAGWSATPTRPAPGQLTAAEQTCLAQLPASDGASPAQWHSILSDIRGRFTMLILESVGRFSSCFAEGSANDGGSGAIPPVPPAGQVEVTGWANSPADPYTVIYGRVGAGVSAVQFPLADGTTVQATVSDGWFAAWWPGSEKVDTASLATAQGTVAQDLAPYSIRRDLDGSVTLTVYTGSAIDAAESGSGENAALAELGVNARVVPIEPSCAEPAGAVIPFTQANSSAAVKALAAQTEPAGTRHGLSWQIHPSAIPAGDTLAIAGPEALDSAGALTSRLALLRAPAPTCAPER